jgi:Uma2 family endonuclease
MSAIAITLPPLQNGDHLNRIQFERRYQAMSRLKKAELLEGIVYMASPLHCDSHAKPHAIIITWLGNYCAATPGVEFADNATVRLDTENELQPDVLLWLPERLGGRARLSEDDYLEGAPELIVEIAASSASYDLHQKREVYRRHGVQEYVVWQVYERRVDWFVLTDGEYVAQSRDAEGFLHSQRFPGLKLDVAALLRRDLATVLNQLHRGVQTPAHQEFVEQLKSLSG